MQYEELERKMERAAKTGEKRRRMKMSGGSVRTLQKIIKNKGSRSKTPKS